MAQSTEESGTQNNRDIWTVSRLNMEVRALLDSKFGQV